MKSIPLATLIPAMAGAEASTAARGAVPDSAGAPATLFTLLTSLATAAGATPEKTATSGEERDDGQRRADVRRDGADGALPALLALLLAPPTQAPDGGVTSFSPADARAQQAWLRLTLQKSGGATACVAQQHADAGIAQTSARQTQPLTLPPLTPAQQAHLVRLSGQQAGQSALKTPAPRVAKPTTAQPAPRHLAKTPPLQSARRQDTRPLAPAVAAIKLAVAPAPQSGAASAAPAVIELDKQYADWGEKLTGMLREHIQFQVDQQQQTSTIRLDPPALGKLEISIQFTAGQLTVHIGANQPEVYQALQQWSDNLRQHLIAQNFVQVNVQVSADGQRQEQQRQPEQQNKEADIHAALMVEQGDAPPPQDESVLIKV